MEDKKAKVKVNSIWQDMATISEFILTIPLRRAKYNESVKTEDNG